jgi:NAD(P) transhydrogenase
MPIVRQDMLTPYDLIVLGSGPAGEKGAAQAAYFGKRVALIEKEAHCGGAAANTGTLPSKTLRESALYLSGFKKRDLYGLNFNFNEKINAQDFLKHFHAVRDQERTRIASNIERHSIDIYQGAGCFVDANTVTVQPLSGEPQTLSSKVFLVATGTKPHRPALFPWEDPRVCDSDTILELEAMPESMLIVGGGVIGSEYACMFAALGVQVTLVDGRSRLLGFLDAEISEALQNAMRSMGIELHLNEDVASVVTAKHLEVTLKTGGLQAYDSILVASGRGGNTATLGLDKAGIIPDKRGLIVTNDHYQTTVPHIYAAGDVIGFPALASTSMEQARVAMTHAFDLKYKKGLARILPLGIYTIPECSSAGDSEEALQEKRIPYVVGKTRYAQNARGFIIGDKEGFLKLIFHAETMKILGVHCIGEQATDLIHVGLTALLLEQDASLFINTCYNYPTLSEMYKYATYDALGRKARGEIVNSTTS